MGVGERDLAGKRFDPSRPALDSGGFSRPNLLHDSSDGAGEADGSTAEWHTGSTGALAVSLVEYQQRVRSSSSPAVNVAYHGALEVTEAVVEPPSLSRMGRGSLKKFRCRASLAALVTTEAGTALGSKRSEHDLADTGCGART